MRSITWSEVLEAGTKVMVKNMVGTIVGHYVAPNGVVVHKIKLTEKRVRVACSIYKTVPINKTIEPNYSFVNVL